MKRIIGVIIAFILLGVGGFYWLNSYIYNQKQGDGTGQPEENLKLKTVVFECTEGKLIEATFYLESDIKVDLNLSDGRALSVPRAISASGARYANQDESLVFWNKGDTAFITEDEVTTYADCVLKAGE